MVRLKKEELRFSKALDIAKRYLIAAPIENNCVSIWPGEPV